MLYVEEGVYKPYAVLLEITRACNMNCKHCGSSATTQNRENPIEYNDWIKLIDELKELGAISIHLTGGEPFLYKRWKDLASYIRKDNKTNFAIITNGSLIKEEDIKFLKEIGASHIAMSLDGPKEIHDDIRQYKGAFDSVVKTVELCKKHDFKFGFISSMGKINFNERNELLEIIKELKPNYWQIQIINSFGRAATEEEDIIITKDQYTELIDDMYKWKHILKEDKINLFPADSIGYCYGPEFEDLLDGAEWYGCNAGKFNVGVESNGNVKGCLSLQDDHFIAGNIKKKTFTEIWNDDDAFWYTRKYDTEKMEGSCKTCSSKEQCKAGCLNIAYSLHETIYKNDYCYKAIKEAKQGV